MKIDEIDENLDENFHLSPTEEAFLQGRFSSVFASFIKQFGPAGQQQIGVRTGGDLVSAERVAIVGFDQRSLAGGKDAEIDPVCRRRFAGRMKRAERGI